MAKRMKKLLLALSALSMGTTCLAEDFFFDPAAESVRVSIPRGEEIGSSSEKTELDGKRALQIDFNCAQARWTQFSFAERERLALEKPFPKLTVRAMVYIPEQNKIFAINLRLKDKYGEYFEYRYKIPASAKGWNSIKYEINTGEEQAASWGRKADRKLDWPLSLDGFAIAFNSAMGVGYAGFGEIKVISGE